MIDSKDQLLEKSNDTDRIVLISKAFFGNLRLRLLSGKTGIKLHRDIQAIVNYAYKAVKKLGGVIASKEGKSILLYYQKSAFYLNSFDKFRLLFIAFFVIRIDRLIGTSRREKIVKSVRNNGLKKFKDNDYLYVWFLAQDIAKKDIKGLVEIKDQIVARAKQLSLPIYMETTEERLIKVYERIGFKFYDCINSNSENFKIWFGRYQPVV